MPCQISHASTVCVSRHQSLPNFHTTQQQLTPRVFCNAVILRSCWFHRPQTWHLGVRLEPFSPAWVLERGQCRVRYAEPFATRQRICSSAERDAEVGVVTMVLLVRFVTSGRAAARSLVIRRQNGHVGTVGQFSIEPNTQ